MYMYLQKLKFHSDMVSCNFTFLMFIEKRVDDAFNLKKIALIWSPHCAGWLNCCTNDETLGRQTPMAICVPFIKMEGVDKCHWERNWWVKHLPPEELYLHLRATVVHFNYHSHTVQYKYAHLVHTCFLSIWITRKRELWYSLWVKFISSQSSNIIGSVLDSWSLGLLCKPKVLLPLAAVLFPWAMGDT